MLTLSALAAGCGVPGDSSLGKAEAPAPEVFEGPVPRAVCGPGSQPETGMQGFVEDVGVGYWCNIELVSHLAGYPSFQMAAYEDCAYYNQDFPAGGWIPPFTQLSPERVANENPGVVVIDASDPADPVETGRLTSPAMLDPHESLKANELRGLVAAVAGWDPLGHGPLFFDAYDVLEDCARPVLVATVPFNVATGHEGEWAPDGMTYYGSSNYERMLSAIDVSDPAAPGLASQIPFGAHGLGISDDGNRAYLATANPPPDPAGNGVRIVDVSQVQARAAVPQVEEISVLTWTDGAYAQHAIPVTIQGTPYLIFVDEGGGGFPAGAARLIDISDEKYPFIASKLKLEVHMPDSGIDLSSLYQAHYCGVPQRNEPGIVACSYVNSGLRVFDIRDPYHPKEIAYFNPAVPELPFASAQPRIVPERGEVWFTDQRSGFYVVRFTNGVWPFAEDVSCGSRC